MVFDEVHNARNLLPYIKERVDTRRNLPGQYLLTGSQNLLLIERITESLAGRAAILRLLPLSRREMAGQPGAPLPWERLAAEPEGHRRDASSKSLWEGFLRGGYPELAIRHDRDVALWHASYVQTYLERDVRALRQVGNLGQFQEFLRATAARSGQLFNLADLARTLGVATNTAKAWLSVLEATHQVVVLRPFFANVDKRLVKTPKVYFTDVGTLCYLSGLRDPDHAASGPLAGAILETAVLGEILKAIVHRGQQPEVYFWRTSAGSEVDFVVDTGRELVPIEVKLSATPRPAMAEGILRFRRDIGRRAAAGYVSASRRRPTAVERRRDGAANGRLVTSDERRTA